MVSPSTITNKLYNPFVVDHYMQLGLETTL